MGIESFLARKPFIGQIWGHCVDMQAVWIGVCGYVEFHGIETKKPPAF
jgi:hypothetical protein